MLNAGWHEIVLGLGCSASTDGGAGLLAALGARLIDTHGSPSFRGTSMKSVAAEQSPGSSTGLVQRWAHRLVTAADAATHEPQQTVVWPGRLTTCEEAVPGCLGYTPRMTALMTEPTVDPTADLTLHPLDGPIGPGLPVGLPEADLDRIAAAATASRVATTRTVYAAKCRLGAMVSSWHAPGQAASRGR